MDEERFSIFCNDCQDSRDLILDSDSNTYRCPDCDSIYYHEDGVFDADTAVYYHLAYKGSELESLLPKEIYEDEYV